ncbi:MAG: hypothetical protein ACRDQZ_26945 [Mycobacteriales bacterium]
MRTAGLIMAMAGLALLASACGGSPGSRVAQLVGSTAAATTENSTGSGTVDKYAVALAYSRCMRSHGVSNFPDPKQDGGGIQISGSQAGMNPHSPGFASAQESCRHLLPGGGEPTHADQKRALARMLHISRCMRAHGISGFPDPTPSAPSDRAGYSSIMSNGGAWLAIPDSIDLGTPAFNHAAAACNLELS